VAQEEIFGPFLRSSRTKPTEAIAIANNSIYGLSGEVSGGDLDRALEGRQAACAQQRDHQQQEPLGITSPFGGTKQSGLGYRNGERGLQGIPGAKTIGMPDTAAP